MRTLDALRRSTTARPPADSERWPLRLGLQVLFALGLVAGPLAAADGDLDPTFHTAAGGVFEAGLPGTADVVKILPAPDGATVIVYQYLPSDGTPPASSWRRVTETGAGAPCPLTSAALPEISASGATFDRQGRLLVVGTRRTSPSLIVIERFLYPACTLDPAFDGNGVAGYLSGEDPIGIDLAALRVGVVPFQADYYYVVGTVQQAETEVVLLRVRLDGGLDVGWGGGDGRVKAGIAGARVSARDLDVDSQGRLVVAVLVEDLSPHDLDFGAFRFLSDGSLDSSFDGNGKKAIPFDLVPDGADTPYAIAVSNDDHVAIIGTVTGEVDEVGVALLREDGSYETAFAGDGRLHDPMGILGRGAAGIFQSDGKLLVGGRRIAPLQDGMETPAYFSPFLARLMPDGELDPGFGQGGIAASDIDAFASHQSGATSAALAAGEPLLAGSVASAGGETDNLFLLRLENSLIFADGFESAALNAW